MLEGVINNNNISSRSYNRSSPFAARTILPGWNANTANEITAQCKMISSPHIEFQNVKTNSIGSKAISRKKNELHKCPIGF